MAGNSKKAVVSAIIGNGCITVLKFFAALVSHSASMMNEAVHSLMDTANQILLFLGLKQGEKPADENYAFGHGQKKYLWNLWSAIGLFSIGSGLGLSHAWHAYHKLEETYAPVANIEFLGVSLSPLYISIVVLIIAFIVEGYVLRIASKEYFLRMKAQNYTNPFTYLFQADDPTLVAVVLEDSIAVIGVCLAMCGIVLTSVTENHFWDIFFSVLIALMLGFAAFFLGWLNMKFLTDIRDNVAEDAFRQIAANHKEIEKYHDLRSIVVDEKNTVVVAEIEIREEALMRGLYDKMEAYMAKQKEKLADSNISDEYQLRRLRDRAIVQATLERAEEIIDEIELELKKACPRVSHITLEVEGIL